MEQVSRQVMQLHTTVKNPQRKPNAKYDWHDIDFPPGLYIVERRVDEPAAEVREVLGEEKYALLQATSPMKVYVYRVGDTRNRLARHVPIDEQHQGINALLLALKPVDAQQAVDVLLIEAGVEYEGYLLEVLRELHSVGKLTAADIQWAARKVRDE